jgi:hypothetical protein
MVLPKILEKFKKLLGIFLPILEANYSSTISHFLHDLENVTNGVEWMDMEEWDQL